MSAAGRHCFDSLKIVVHILSAIKGVFPKDLEHMLNHADVFKYKAPALFGLEPALVPPPPAVTPLSLELYHPNFAQG